jgi:elongation factor Tu
MNRAPDCLGTLSLLPTDEGGRKGFVLSGYRPQHLLHDNYQTSGLHEYFDVECLEPGQSASVKVWFITPEVYPQSLWPGRRIGVFEGARKVGSLLVHEVLNPVLAGCAESFTPVWSPPPIFECGAAGMARQETIAPPEQQQIADLLGKLELDPSFDYKAERSRRE